AAHQDRNPAPRRRAQFSTVAQVSKAVLNVAERALDRLLVIGKSLVPSGLGLVNCRGNSSTGIDRPCDVPGVGPAVGWTCKQLAQRRTGKTEQAGQADAGKE